MDRVAFLIEETHTRLACMLNPESFEIQRSSGVTRTSAGLLTNSDLSDDPLIFSGRGSTSLSLQLLFDVTLAGSSIQTGDVRDLTAPLWDLAEYKTSRRSLQELPVARFIWGKAWNIPVVVASVSERYERFTAGGVPQRSWLSLSLMRVSEIVRSGNVRRAQPPQQFPTRAELGTSDTSWKAHEEIGDGVNGDRLDQLASRYYGRPELWRLIAVANGIRNPARVAPGKVLQIPPASSMRKQS